MMSPISTGAIIVTLHAPKHNSTGRSGIRTWWTTQFVVLAGISGIACAPSLDRPAPQSPPDMADDSCERGQSCKSDALCVAGRCVAFDRPCAGDRDCSGDSYCACESSGDGGVSCARRGCIPWGTAHGYIYDEACHRDLGQPVMPLPVTEECVWEEATGVVVTPVVAEIDGVSPPEIVVVTVGKNQRAQVVALHGETCKPLWSTPIRRAGGGGLAVADLDGDRRAEIVLEAETPPKIAIVNSNGVATSYPGEVNYLASPSIADVTGMGTPAAAFGARVWMLGNGIKGVARLFERSPLYDSRFEITVFADLDADGRPELVTGRDVLDGMTGQSKRPPHLMEADREIYPAIADMNGDGLPEIVSVQPLGNGYQLAIFDYSHDEYLIHTMLASPAPWGAGGPPLIDDFDGDGIPDVAIAGDTEFCVYSLRCLAGGARPSWCDSLHPGAIWCVQTQDRSSGVCGATSFDFDDDGIPEIVYRDECWLRILDGRTGEARFTRPMASGTLNDFPVVADVDGDGEAEIVVPGTPWNSCPGTPEPATGTPWTQPPSGILVLGSGGHHWPAARGLWSSSSYHVTEIGDDLSIPRREAASWKVHNTYRRNTNPTDAPWTLLPDLTAGTLRDTIEPSGGSCNEWRLSGRICNRGTRATPAGLPATFYGADPASMNAPALCTAQTDARLDPGACATVSCTAKATGAQTDLWLRVNDDGTSRPVPECKDWNDVSFVRGAKCTAPQ